jgi:hypothetical protein
VRPLIGAAAYVDRVRDVSGADFVHEIGMHVEHRLRVVTAGMAKFMGRPFRGGATRSSTSLQDAGSLPCTR